MKNIVFGLLAVSMTMTLTPRDLLASPTAQDLSPIAADVANLKDQLEKGLKARRPEEFAFLATVVTMVDNKQLPLELVLGTFHWARKNVKYKEKEYAYPYFERGLRERAAELGVTIP